MKDARQTKVLLASGLSIILFASIITPAFAQENAHRKTKDWTKKISDLESQRQALEKQLEAASKSYDIAIIKKIVPEYKITWDQINKTLQKMTRGHKPKSMIEDPTIPKLDPNLGKSFRVSGVQLGCDLQLEWSSGTGNVYTGTPQAFYGVQTQPSISIGEWPLCRSGSIDYAKINTYDTTTGDSYIGQQKLHVDVTGNQAYLLASTFLRDQYGIPDNFITGHGYYIIIAFYYNGGSLLDAGEFTA